MKFLVIILNIIRCLFIVRNSSVISMVKNWLSIGIEMLLVGLIMEVKFRFICIEMICLVIMKVWNSNCREKLSKVLIRICLLISSMVFMFSVFICGIGGRFGISIM